MAIEECHHCIKKVIFNDHDICPNCGKSKYESAGKSRNSILIDQEIEELSHELSYRTKMSTSLLLGGGVIFIAATVISIWTTIQGFVTIWWYGGVIGGFGMVTRGYSDFKRKRILQKALILAKKEKQNVR